MASMGLQGTCRPWHSVTGSIRGRLKCIIWKTQVSKAFGVNGLFPTLMEIHTNISAASLLHWVIYEKSQVLPKNHIIMHSMCCRKASSFQDWINVHSFTFFMFPLQLLWKSEWILGSQIGELWRIIQSALMLNVDEAFMLKCRWSPRAPCESYAGPSPG